MRRRIGLCRSEGRSSSTACDHCRPVRLAIAGSVRVTSSGGPSHSVESRSDATGRDPRRRLVRALADPGGNALPRPPRRGNRRRPRADRLHRPRGLRRDGAGRGLSARSRRGTPILRTRFRHDDGGRPVQEVVETRGDPSRTTRPHRRRRGRASQPVRRRLCASDRARGIDLEQRPGDAAD